MSNRTDRPIFLIIFNRPILRVVNRGYRLLIHGILIRKSLTVLENAEGLWATQAKNGDETVTVTGQNHNFYTKEIRNSRKIYLCAK